MDNRPKLLVMGGSFNPPTRAHVDFLLDAMWQMEAKEGIFVPSSHRYVSRKMAKYQEWNLVYTEAQRLEMLERICELYPNLSVMIGDLPGAVPCPLQGTTVSGRRYLIHYGKKTGNDERLGRVVKACDTRRPFLFKTDRDEIKERKRNYE